MGKNGHSSPQQWPEQSTDATSSVPPVQPPTTYNHASLPLHFLPSAPQALTHSSHMVEMQAQQATAPSFQPPVSSPSSPLPTTSLRDLEVSTAKLYAIVNTQAAANREKDTINQN